MINGQIYTYIFLLSEMFCSFCAFVILIDLTVCVNAKIDVNYLSKDNSHMPNDYVSVTNLPQD